jgi:hypothetical protein
VDGELLPFFAELADLTVEPMQSVAFLNRQPVVTFSELLWLLVSSVPRLLQGSLTTGRCEPIILERS